MEKMENPSDFNHELVQLIRNSNWQNKEKLIQGIKNLINCGANVHAQLAVSADGTEIQTLLEFALQNIESPDLKFAICKILLDRGIDPNGNNGLSFAAACASGDSEIFNLFINYGANIHTKDPTGKSMLHHAAAGGNLAILEWLLNKGLNIDVIDNFGNTLLHIAAHYKQRDLCDYLLKAGFKIDTYNHNGKTPLLLAAVKNPHILKGSMDEKQKAFRERRTICEDMIIHQVNVNKNIITLLGCIRKISTTGNLAAISLYRERNSLLKPYLQDYFCSLSSILKDQKPYRKLVKFRKKAHSRTFNLPRHEYQWSSELYCGFLLPSTIEHTNNLKRPFVTGDWTSHLWPLHNIAHKSNNILPIAMPSSQPIATKPELSINNDFNNESLQNIDRPLATLRTAIRPQFSDAQQPIQSSNNFYHQAHNDPVQFIQKEDRNNRFILKITLTASIAVAAYMIYNWVTNNEEESSCDSENEAPIQNKRIIYSEWPAPNLS